MPVAPKMQRFLVRRKTREVFIWTEALAKGFPEMEEVLAPTAQDAIDARTMPDPRRISILELESMTKKDLILFAHMKLGLELDAGKPLKRLQDEVKEAVFTATRLPDDELIEEVQVDMTSAAAREGGRAVTRTVPLKDVKAVRTQKGA